MHSLFLIGSLFLIAPGQGPLAPIQGQEVTRIVIKAPPAAEPGGDIVLSDQRDIDRVVRGLSDMTKRAMDHSSPDFNLAFETRDGHSLVLRMSASEVGPDAAASAYVTHWFPRDKEAFRELHGWLMQKATPGR